MCTTAITPRAFSHTIHDPDQNRCGCKLLVLGGIAEVGWKTGWFRHARTHHHVSVVDLTFQQPETPAKAEIDEILTAASKGRIKRYS